MSFAEGLIGKSLTDYLQNDPESLGATNKGDLGTLVQTLFFGLEADNISQPDFFEAGLELKTTGVIRARSGEFKAKERLVLMMIDYSKIVEETWETSALLQKCRLILLLAYLFDRETSPANRTFVLGPILLDLLSEQFHEVKSDWETIRQTVVDGKAHELSEGDTFVLGACRKGAGGPSEPLRRQPNSHEGAKARAYSFKQSFVTQIISAKTEQMSVSGASRDLRTVPRTAFSEFLGLSIEQLAAHFRFHKKSKNHKGYHRQLAEKMLIEGGSSKAELADFGIEMKTIRLGSNGRPREHMSFRGFEFLEIVNQDWEDSSFFESLESKFLFVVFREHPDGTERLDRATYWNMPYEDRLEARRVWEDTRKRILVDATDLPKSGESPVAHVRPKGRDGSDKILTPQGNLHLRQCFWINKEYLADIVSPPTTYQNF
jgi:DNA mismatch repair protein MutH